MTTNPVKNKISSLIRGKEIDDRKMHIRIPGTLSYISFTLIRIKKYRILIKTIKTLTSLEYSWNLFPKNTYAWRTARKNAPRKKIV